MKKVAFITTGFTGSTLPLAKALTDMGYIVDYFILRNEIHDMEAFQCEYKAKGYGVKVVPNSYWPELNATLVNSSFRLYCISLPRPYKSIPWVSRCLSYIRKKMIELISRRMIEASYAFVNIVGRYDADELRYYIKSLCGHTKVIVSLHEVAPNKDFSSEHISTPLMSLLFNQKIDIVVHSENSYNEIRRYKDCSIEFIHRIPFGLFETYKTVPMDTSLSIPDDFILFFGGIFPYKGLSVLYRSVDSHRDSFANTKIVVAGKGEDPILDMVKSDDSFLCINRRLSSPELVSLIAHSRFVVCPHLVMSQSGIPQTTFVFDKPLIVSDLPAFKEVIFNGENGLTFKTGDAEDLFLKIEELLNNVNLYHSMTNNIKSFTNLHNSFDWSNIANQYLKIAN